MEFLARLVLTILISPLCLIIVFFPSFVWEGYGEKRAAQRKEAAWRAEQETRREELARRKQEEAQRAEEQEARQRAVADWMAAHPVEAARINQEQERRLTAAETARRARLAAEEEERRAKLAAEEEERRAKLAADEEERRKAQQVLEAALAIPLSAKKAKLLSEMPFPPSLENLQSFAREEGE
jgi:hypothetical protein